MYFKLAWRNIWRNKRRTFLTAASIMFAVFFAIVMSAMQFGSYNRMVENVVQFYSGYAQIHHPQYWEEKSLDYSYPYTQTINDLSNEIPEVTNIVPRLESFALASFGKLTRGSLVVGIDPEKEQSLTGIKDKINDGDYLAADDTSALITEGLAHHLKVGVGDTLVLISQGYHGVNAAGLFPIKGIVKFPSPDLNSRLVLMPLKTAQWFYGADSLVTSSALVIDKAKSLDVVMQQLESKLDTSVYSLMSWKEMMPELVQQIELDRTGGLIMLFILYVIIGFGIFGTILMMAAERSYEFGVLMAIGLKRAQLTFVIWIEVIMLAMLGVVMGIVMSLPVVYYFKYNPIRFTGDYAKAFESFGIEPIIPFATDFFIFTQQAWIVFVITSLIAIYPLWKIYHLRPIKAMRE